VNSPHPRRGDGAVVVTDHAPAPGPSSAGGPGATLVQYKEPTSLVQVDDQCAAVEAWAEQCDSVPELRDASNKLAAIDEYLTRTSTEGRARVAAAMRRLEVRIGSVLGPAQHGGDRSGEQVVHDQLDPRQRHDFRRMAQNRDLVEDEIATSTDDQPASRRRVTDAIRNHLDRVEHYAKQQKREAEEQREWVESLGTDPNPNATQLRTTVAHAVIGLRMGVDELTKVTPAQLAEALASYPSRQLHVRDQYLADVHRAASEIARYVEAVR
jgi:hypothetical protein